MTQHRPPPKTNAQIQADQREREKNRGLKRKTIVIPADKEPELIEIVRRWKDTDPAKNP